MMLLINERFPFHSHPPTPQHRLGIPKWDKRPCDFEHVRRAIYLQRLKSDARYTAGEVGRGVNVISNCFREWRKNGRYIGKGIPIFFFQWNVFTFWKFLGNTTFEKRLVLVIFRFWHYYFNRLVTRVFYWQGWGGGKLHKIPFREVPAR